jgi:DNA-binding LacI/PurR family transcriptional regulator
MKERRSVTLREVAARAGVGPATASVVINGAKSGTKVSEATREAILKAAKDLKYRPNVLARSLRKRRTGIVGFFSGYQYLDPRNEYMADVMSGLQEGCGLHGMNLLLYTPTAALQPEEIVDNLSDGRLDGLVVTARPEHRISTLLAETHLPVVAVADKVPGIPCVLADAFNGGVLQARHLHERGHRRVLYLPGDYPFASVLDRYEGFTAEAGRLGMEVVLAQPVCGHGVPLGWQLERRHRIPEEDLAKLRGPARCTAVQCWDDAPAFRLAAQLTEAGFRVPDDVAIVGYNGCTGAVEPRWHLTTIRAGWPRVGATAIEVLAAYIEGREYPEETVLPVELEQGATT